MTEPTAWNANPAHFWMYGHRPDKPVEFSDQLGAWLVTGYPEAQQILADTTTFQSDTRRLYPEADAALADYPELVTGDLLSMDGVHHRERRGLISRVFTPRVVADMEPRITKLVHELVDGFAGKPEFDLVTELAYPLPVTVIAEMLGVPASDRDLFIHWADKLFDSKNIYYDSAPGHDAVAASQAAFQEFLPMLDYLKQHARERKQRPREDLLTLLTGSGLSDVDVTGFATLLLIAGHVTTTQLLGSTILCLDRYRDAARAVRADRALVPGAIEESLRLISPVSGIARATGTDVEIAGQAIPADRMVMIALGAVNRDPRQFTDPDTFDLSRDPNPHLGFGRGVHFCLGAPLARLEGRIAVNVLLDRLGDLRTDPANPPVFHPSVEITGARHLPVKQTQRGDA